MSGAGQSPRVVIVGLGHPDRGDDAVGVLVSTGAADLLGLSTAVLSSMQPVDLIEEWGDTDVAVVVDAVRSGAPPGTVYVTEPGDMDVSPGAGPAARGSWSTRSGGGAPGPASTHGLGLAWALRLSRAIGTAPGRVVLVGIEGSDFSAGSGLSPGVAAAVPDAVGAVVAAVRGAAVRGAAVRGTAGGRSDQRPY